MIDCDVNGGMVGWWDCAWCVKREASSVKCKCPRRGRLVNGMGGGEIGESKAAPDQRPTSKCITYSTDATVGIHYVRLWLAQHALLTYHMGQDSPPGL